MRIDLMSVRFGMNKSRIDLGTQKPDGLKRVRFISSQNIIRKILEDYNLHGTNIDKKIQLKTNFSIPQKRAAPHTGETLVSDFLSTASEFRRIRLSVPGINQMASGKIFFLHQNSVPAPS